MHEVEKARALTERDLDWAVEVLGRRRARLAPHAPVYWRPAIDAAERHRQFMSYVVGEGGGFGFRTDDSVIISSPGGSGWTIDDAWVSPDQWPEEGLLLWDSTLAQTGPDPLRFVCPTFEPERAAFAADRGLSLASSWWHLEVRRTGAAVADGEASVAQPHLDGATTVLVSAPPVYDPGGPILFLRDVHDRAAVTSASAEADRLECPVVVVDQPAGADDLGGVLAENGYLRHCDFFDSDGVRP